VGKEFAIENSAQFVALFKERDMRCGGSVNRGHFG
jgi:hypothetical protein